MPNPFARLGQPVRSKKPPNETPVEPVMEEYVGDNNPYRGVQSHGVPPTVLPPELLNAWPEDVDVDYDEPIPEQQPVPVLVVDSGSRQKRLVRFYHSAAQSNTNPPMMILSEDMNRQKVTIKNIGAAGVYIGEDHQSANPVNGWPLAITDPPMESKTQGPLYAMSADGNQQPLAIQAEYTVEL